MVKPLDITGERYNSLTVIKRVENTKRGQSQWLCKCDCGKETTVIGAKLKFGSTKSCGCAKGAAQKRRTEDLTGQKFNRLTVLRMAGYKRNNAVCKCKCDCGKTIEAMAYEVKTGHTKSCGCLNDDGRRVANLQHGHRRSKTGPASREYRSWRSMKQRCYDDKQVGYPNYGGRGIKVCKRWLNSFKNFLEDMGERPEDTSLDRIDNDGDYTPDNCRWADAKMQYCNQRKDV